MNPGIDTHNAKIYTFVHMRTRQLNLIPKMTSAYGGDRLKTRKGRAYGRPLSTKETMHLVLRSTMAKGEWSFLRPNHQKLVKTLIQKFSVKHGVHIYSVANVGNHLHLQIKLSNRTTYRRFIRALTAAIAIAITRRSRWTFKPGMDRLKFWNRRPYSRIVVGRRSYLGLQDYIQINRIEGAGFTRNEARMIVSLDRGRAPPAASHPCGSKQS